MNPSTLIEEPRPALEVAAVRADFPILEQQVNGRSLIYLDNAASSQKPRSVIEALERYYREDNANVHRGIHELSRRATEQYEDARVRVADFIGASDPAELIFTSGTTEALNLVARSWGDANLREGDEVLLSVLEHHSNLVPWQLLAERTGARLRFLDIDHQGRLRLDQLGELLSGRTKLVSLGHVSNSLGTVNPVGEVARRAHATGALVVVDGAQAAPHLPVNVAELGCDFFAFSGHKMCGPTGVGALWGRRELLEAMPPFLGGGDMIRSVELESSTWAELPHKFEAGTPKIAQVIGLGAAVDYLSGLGMERVHAHEVEVTGYALERLAGVPDLTVHGPPAGDGRAGVISFTLADVHPHDLATILDGEGVAIRAGHHCTQPLMKRLGVAATARASFYLYNTSEDADRLVEGLGRARSLFGY
ncbi:MAG: cysteine desulfurase [Longimicrobiaceae bacterium]